MSIFKRKSEGTGQASLLDEKGVNYKVVSIPKALDKAYFEAQETSKRATLDQKNLKKKIEAKILGADKAIGQYMTFTLVVPEEKPTVNETLLKEKYPEVYAKVCVNKPGVPFYRGTVNK